MNWKVCGMRDEQNIKDILALNPTWMGFIFYEKSPRYVVDKLSPRFLQNWNTTTKKVGVFVNPSLDWMLQQAHDYGLDVVQIHGGFLTENEYEQIKKANLAVVQAVAVGERIDFEELVKWERFIDYFLFDTKSSSHGGTGQSFDWNLLSDYQLAKPFLLAGGISLDNFHDLPDWRQLPFWGIDVNSRFEISPANKNKTALATLSNRIEDIKKTQL